MANYADYIQFPDTMINGNYVERYAFPDSTGMYTDSVAWYRTPEGYKVADRNDAKLYKLDHPEGRPYVAKTYSEDERQKLFNDAFGKSKLDGVEQKSDGGILSQAPKELVELVQAAMSDESAALQLSELKSKRPDLTDMIDQIIAELQGAQTMKCGGRVKKKALGSKLIKAKKASCGCMLKKVGGRLIEVDTCTGLPVHRHGGNVKKYKNTPGPLTYVQQALNGPETNLTAAISDSFLTGNIPHVTASGNVVAGRQTMSTGDDMEKVRYINGLAYPVFEDVDETGKGNGLKYYSLGMTRLKDGSFMYTDPKTGDLYYNNGRVLRVNTGKIENYDPISFFDKSPSNILQLRAYGFLMGPLSVKREVTSSAGATPTWRDTFGAGKAGKFGGKTYDEALALQNEMLNADWFDANLGTSGINKNGADGMWGATSQKEYARYLAEKQRREEQATAAAAAEAEKQELNNLQASSIRRTTSDGMTNEALLAMDAGKAMSTLSRPDYERWMKLNQHQQGRNASLVYNGKRYNDETAYNAAVDAETARTAPQLDMQALLNTRGRRKRNAAYAQYQASMDKHVANNPYYSGPKALTQEQLSATSFKNGGQLNYANYLN